MGKVRCLDLADNVSVLFIIKHTGFHIPAPKHLAYDIKMFIRVNPDLTPKETAQKLCREWAGYRKEYGEERIEEFVIGGSWRTAER